MQSDAVKPSIQLYGKHWLREGSREGAFPTGLSGGNPQPLLSLPTWALRISFDSISPPCPLTASLLPAIFLPFEAHYAENSLTATRRQNGRSPKIVHPLIPASSPPSLWPLGHLPKAVIYFSPCPTATQGPSPFRTMASKAKALNMFSFPKMLKTLCVCAIIHKTHLKVYNLMNYHKVNTFMQSPRSRNRTWHPRSALHIPFTVISCLPEGTRDEFYLLVNFIKIESITQYMHLCLAYFVQCSVCEGDTHGCV